jgi:hypothetical protein
VVVFVEVVVVVDVVVVVVAAVVVVVVGNDVVVTIGTSQSSVRSGAAMVAVGAAVGGAGGITYVPSGS